MPDPVPTSSLDSELQELGRWLDVPPERDVVAAVRARVDTDRPVDGEHRARWVSRTAAVLLALVTLAAAAVAASPRIRAALFDVLRIGSVEVHSGPAPTAASSYPPSPSLSNQSAQASSSPGAEGRMHSTTLATARRSAAFDVLVPGGALGRPDEVLAEDGPHPSYVALRYRPGPGRPPAARSGVAIELDEIAGDGSPFLEKYLNGTAARLVRVDGAPGVWIDGPHELIVADRAGAIRVEPPRLAARTLVWQRDGVTLRLEGELTLSAALAIAASLQ